MFTGTVTRAETGEPLPGILMSDGRNCTRTDRNGRYRLPGWERCRQIYACVLTNRHDDWYCSSDKKKNDFALDPAEAGEATFLHFSDTEIEKRPDVRWLDFVRQQVKKTGCAFVMDTGDLCNENGLYRTRFILNRETVGVPVRYAIGNHDFYKGAYGEEAYERLYGPTWYSFDQGGVHFVVMNIGKSKLYLSGYQPEDQWIWLENDLAASGAKEFVAFQHTRLQDEQDFTEPVGEKIYDLKAMGLRGWFRGHAHTHYAHLSKGILAVCTSRPDDGGIDSSEAGVRFVKIKKKNIETRLIYNTPAPKKGDPFLWRAALPGRVSRGAPVTDGERIYIGTFDDGFPKKCGVHALDAKTGKLLWSRLTENGVKGPVACAEGKVYAEDTAGVLHILSAGTGEELARRESVSNATRAGVLFADGKIFYGASYQLWALDPKTDQVIWQSEPAGKGRENGPAAHRWDPWRRQILCSSQWWGLYARDPDTGKETWSKHDVPVRFRSSTPLVTKKAIYTSGRGHFISLDPETGAYIRTVPAGGNVETAGRPLLWNGVLYVPTGSMGVAAVDPETLEVLRKFPVGPAKLFTVPYQRGGRQTVESSPLALDGLLTFAGMDGVLYRYRPEGELVKTIDVGAPVTADLLATDEAVITADFVGRVTAYGR